MKTLKRDLVIIGGGPAGMAAAVEAKKIGIKKVTIIERDIELGGILQQCIHDGFGLITFRERLTGGQYAQRYINMTDEEEVEVMLDTMVVEMTEDRRVYAASEAEGLMEIQAGSIILAMGCRERTRSQVMISGTRPAGVLTAGTVQRYINMEGYLPGKKAVILGSGDIGLIMARRMTLENIEVEGVYEIMPEKGGLTRNVEQCLNDYDIPLYLGTTVVDIRGKKRLEGVTVAKVDDKLQVIPGTQRDIDCDLLVLSVGLIPENELSTNAGIEIDPVTKGPVVDDNMMTSIPGIFAAGNVVAVFDLVDFVSKTGEVAAAGAAKFMAGDLAKKPKYTYFETGENLSFVVPQRIEKNTMDDQLTIYMRVRNEDSKSILTMGMAEDEFKVGRFSIVKPPEMVHATLKKESVLKLGDNKLMFDMRKEG